MAKRVRVDGLSRDGEGMKSEIAEHKCLGKCILEQMKGTEEILFSFFFSCLANLKNALVPIN